MLNDKPRNKTCANDAFLKTFEHLHMTELKFANAGLRTRTWLLCVCVCVYIYIYILMTNYVIVMYKNYLISLPLLCMDIECKKNGILI